MYGTCNVNAAGGDQQDPGPGQQRWQGAEEQKAEDDRGDDFDVSERCQCRRVGVNESEYQQGLVDRTGQYQQRDPGPGRVWYRLPLAGQHQRQHDRGANGTGESRDQRWRNLAELTVQRELYADYGGAGENQEGADIDLVELGAHHQQHAGEAADNTDPDRPAGFFVQNEGCDDDQQEGVGVQDRDRVGIVDCLGALDEQRGRRRQRQAAHGLNQRPCRPQRRQAVAPEQEWQHQQTHAGEAKPGDLYHRDLVAEQFHQRTGKRGQRQADTDDDDAAAERFGGGQVSDRIHRAIIE